MKAMFRIKNQWNQLFPATKKPNHGAGNLITGSSKSIQLQLFSKKYFCLKRIKSKHPGPQSSQGSPLWSSQDPSSAELRHWPLHAQMDLCLYKRLLRVFDETSTGRQLDICLSKTNQWKSRGSYNYVLSFEYSDNDIVPKMITLYQALSSYPVLNAPPFVLLHQKKTIITLVGDKHYLTNVLLQRLNTTKMMFVPQEIPNNPHKWMQCLCSWNCLTAQSYVSGLKRLSRIARKLKRHFIGKYSKNFQKTATESLFEMMWLKHSE